MKTLARLRAALALALAVAAGGAAAEMSDTKRALVLELLEIAGGADTSARLGDLFLAQLQAVYPELVDGVLESEAQLDAEERRRLRAHLADFDSFAVLFQKRFAEQIDVASIQERVYLPLYDRYFSEEELARIVAFYRTPAGRKAVDVMPMLMQEAMAQTLPSLEPQVMQLVGTILADRAEGLFLGSEPSE